LRWNRWGCRRFLSPVGYRRNGDGRGGVAGARPPVNPSTGLESQPQHRPQVGRHRIRGISMNSSRNWSTWIFSTDHCRLRRRCDLICSGSSITRLAVELSSGANRRCVDVPARTAFSRPDGIDATVFADSNRKSLSTDRPSAVAEPVSLGYLTPDVEFVVASIWAGSLAFGPTGITSLMESSVLGSPPLPPLWRRRASRTCARDSAARPGRCAAEGRLVSSSVTTAHVPNRGNDEVASFESRTFPLVRATVIRQDAGAW
jgi:hypothetical protein